MSDDVKQAPTPNGPDGWTCTECGAVFPSHQKLGGHMAGKHHTKIERKECDGSLQDYRRHRSRKEKCCPASKAEWRKYRAAQRTAGKTLTPTQRGAV